MRTFIVLAAVAATFYGCSGSTSTTNDDGGGLLDGSSGSSSGGSGTGSCPQLGGTYMFHWTTTSGGSTCDAHKPSDGTAVLDAGAASPLAVPTGAGVTCTMTNAGCMVSAMCTIDYGEGGAGSFSESFVVASDGTITGTIMESVLIGGQGFSCQFATTSTRVP